MHACGAAPDALGLVAGQSALPHTWHIMGKVAEIERRMCELEAGVFQRLCNAYLRKRGYEQINALGSVIGSDKTRQGTPDTYVPLSNGKYVFVESTTTSDGLFQKLRDDVEKCLDETRTGVPVERIEELVLCHTGQLDVSQREELNGLCRERLNLQVFGIHVIAVDLAEKFPGVAREYLGVEVDTGQVLSPGEFTDQYARNALAAPLDTVLVGRQVELDSGAAALARADLLLVSGPPGVGKSRLALAVMERYVAENSHFQPWCLLSRGQDLFVDLKSYFSDDGSFILLADDANRLSRFDYVVELLQSRRPGQYIKVIVTVRDYARERIRETARRLGAFEELTLEPLKDEDVLRIVREGFGIRNFQYLERIRDLARGNPRLAVMAGRIAKERQTLNSIADATDLYEEYFGSIRRDLEGLDQPNLLRVAAVIAFFRVVDRSNGPMMVAIDAAFGISAEAFWQSVLELHQHEVVDVYDNEIVRTSDQVLATYLFYRAFFKERSLQFSGLLTHFFPALRERIVDALNGVLRAFNAERLMEMMRPAVLDHWRLIEGRGAHNVLERFMETFWVFDPTACLRYARDEVRGQTQEQSVNELTVELRERPGQEQPSPFAILALLRHGDQGTVTSAIELILEWIERRPSEAGKALGLLQRSYGLTPRSSLVGYQAERAVLDSLWQRAEAGGLLMGRVFVAVAREYLRIEFEHSESTGNAIRLTRFTLPHDSSTVAFRELAWSRLFRLYRDAPALRPEILDAIQGYGQSGHVRQVNDSAAEDARLMQSFFESDLEPDDYWHCVVVHDVACWFECEGVAFDTSLVSRFTNPAFGTAEVLLERSWHRADMSYEAFQERKRQRIEGLSNGLDMDGLRNLWRHCETIRRHLKQGYEHQLQSAVEVVLESLARRDRALFLQTLEDYLAGGDALRLSPGPVVEALLRVTNDDEALRVLATPAYPTRTAWLLEYYYLLPDASLTEESLAALYELLRAVPADQLHLNCNALARYRRIDSRVVPVAIEILLDRTTNGSSRVSVGHLFHSTTTREHLGEFFGNDVALLERAYLAHCGSERHADPSNAILGQIVDLDPLFLEEFIDFMSSESLGGRWDYERRAFDFLWQRPDAHELAERIASRQVQRGSEFYGMGRDVLAATFRLSDGADATRLREVQDEFLQAMIRSHAHDRDWLMHLFSVAEDLDDDRRRECIRVFLTENSNPELFGELPLESAERSWSGSAVPMYRRRTEFLESLLPLVSGLGYLDHRQGIEGRIEELRRQIEEEERRDFMVDR